MSEVRGRLSLHGVETSLLDLDSNYAMTDFWSPSRPAVGSLAPPSSPKTSANDFDEGDQLYLSSHYQSLPYLNRQLADQRVKDDALQSQIVSFNRPARRFSWQTESSSSSDDGCSAEEPYFGVLSNPNDDSATLVNVSGEERTSCSESNTISGDSVNSSCSVSPRWKESLAKLDKGSQKAWNSTISIGQSAASRPSIVRRPNPLIPNPQASYISCGPADSAVSPSTTRSVSIDPTPSLSPIDMVDMRANSWPSFTDETYSSGLKSPKRPEQPEKSSWDPDSSDDEQETMPLKEQSLGKLRRKFGRRVSDTLRPLFCRS